MAQSLQFFRRIMLLLNVTVGAFLVWVFGMTPVLAARQAVRVRIAAEERRLGITVTDNGCGCAKIEPGFGLRHMRERLRLLNGTLKVKSEKGFELHAEIPLRWGDVYD